MPKDKLSELQEKQRKIAAAIERERGAAAQSMGKLFLDTPLRHWKRPALKRLAKQLEKLPHDIDPAAIEQAIASLARTESSSPSMATGHEPVSGSDTRFVDTEAA